MTLEIYLAYLLACLLITLIPGPTVTLIVANSLSHGTRAGLLNVAGTQAGLALMMLTLIVGLSSVIEAMGWLFDWLRIAGALYLAWLGWKLLRSPDFDLRTQAAPAPRGGFEIQRCIPDRRQPLARPYPNPLAQIGNAPPNPASRARATACARLCTPSLEKILVT
jgi:threonine/homoserine/homoserine lactone efflux protein